MAEWRNVTLGDLGADQPAAFATGPFGSAVSSENFVSEGVPMIRGGNLSEDVAVRLDESDLVFVPKQLADQYSRSNVQRGDLVFTCWGTVGQIGIIDDRARYSRYLVSNKQMKITVAPGRVLPLFLYYYLSQKAMLSLVKGQSIGSSVPGFNLGQLKALPVRIPPLADQHSIVAVLGALDDKIAANEEMAKTALELGDALFFREFSSAVDRSVTIGQLADSSAIEFSDGYRTKKAEHGQPGLRILRAGDVRNSYVYPSGDDYVSLDYESKIGCKASEPGDIVLTTKGTVGRVAVVAEGIEKVAYSPQVCFFRVLDESKIDRAFLAAWFRSADLQNQTAPLMFKSDMAPYISLRDIRSLVVPLPDIELQRRHGEIQRGLHETFAASRSENDRLARTRDELLPLLMSGKVSVRDAEAIAGEGP